MAQQHDQAWHDRQYNNRARVPQSAQILARWAEASALARQGLPGRLDLPYGSGPAERLDVFPAEQLGVPVLVFIHGGNNQTGNTKEILGSELVVRDNCVFVTLDYRLGLFGFNCLPSAGAAMTPATSPCWTSPRHWTGSRITLHSLAAMRTTSPSPVSRPAVVT